MAATASDTRRRRRGRRPARSRSKNGAAGSRAASGGNGGGGRRAASAALDELLTEAATPARRWFPGRAGAKAAYRIATRPQKVVATGAGLAGELAKIAIGRSEVEPEKSDRRFKDPGWQTNPAFKRIEQGYLAGCAAVDRLISAADLDWRSERRVRFAAENVLDLLSPSNFPPTNPSVLKATVDAGGLNFVKGASQLVRDMSQRPRIPSMVDESAFEVGKNLAVTEGSVVLRTPMFELLQYRPQTSKVRETPVLFVPPQINKYYVTDLAPDRSMAEHLLRAGLQVFAISWRNPDERHADWGLEQYAQSILEALDAVEVISGSERTSVLGLCAGGIVLSTVLSHIAQGDRADRIASVSFGVTALDNARAGTAGAMIDRVTASAAVADSARRGYLDGRALAGVFAWLRPNDLIWNYVVNNYMLGKEPPAFDVLYWNADTTRLPAALHRDFVKLSLDNQLTEPGSLKLLGTPVDLSKITTDAYVVGGIADHIIPWESAYRTTQLLGSEPRFVLSTSGHIAAMVNPPGNEKASYQTNDHNPADASEWLAGASKHRGSWWEDWAAWLTERAGDERGAPRKLGGRGYKVVGPAPGRYVREH